jgi:hypothetical protein
MADKPTTNSIIELHDTTLVAMIEIGTQIIVLLEAVIHRSDDRPGIDAGSCWIQAAILTFSEAAIEGTANGLPADIADGDLIVDGEVLSNIVPIPFSHAGEVVLKLDLFTSAKIVIRGKYAVLTLIGEAVYVQEFPGPDTSE